MTVASIPVREPIAAIELEMPPDGSGGFGATTQLAGEPAALFVKAPEWNQWSWALMRWHAPDAAAVCLLIVLPVLVRMMWKARKRNRVPGHVYCAACEHELVEPQVAIVDSDRAEWGGVDARCPECGSRKQPVIAGAYLRRMKGRIVAAAVVLGVAVCTLVMTLTGKTATQQSVSWYSAWPDWRLPYAWSEWPLYRATPADELRTQAVWRVPLDGLIPRRILRGSTALAEPFVSESGRLVALGATSRVGGIIVLDRESGAVREFLIPSDRKMEAMVVGFGLRDRSVLVALVSNEPTRIEFWKVEVASGGMTRSGLIDVPNRELPIMQFIPPVAIEDERGVRWAFAGSTNLSDQQYRDFAFVGGPGGWKRYDRDQPRPLTSARIAPDLSGVRLEWDPFINGVDTGRWFWNFERGDSVPWTTELPVPTNRLRMDRGSGGAPTGSGIITDVVVLDGQSEAAVTLAGSAGLGQDWFASPDGRFVAGVVTRTEASWLQRWISNWPSRRTAKLVVWDLSPK